MPTLSPKHQTPTSGPRHERQDTNPGTQGRLEVGARTRLEQREKGGENETQAGHLIIPPSGSDCQANTVFVHTIEETLNAMLDTEAVPLHADCRGTIKTFRKYSQAH